MEPIRGVKLAMLEDYDSYTPSLEGFRPPPQGPGLVNVDIKASLECLSKFYPFEQIMRCHAPEDAASPGVVIDSGRVLPPILTPDDISSILRRGVKSYDEGSKSVYAVDARRISRTDPEWANVEKEGIKDALYMMTRDDVEHQLVNLTAISPGNHTLNTDPVSERHFATVLVFLPSQRGDAFISARHGYRKNKEDLREVTEYRPGSSRHRHRARSTFSPYFAAFYTGIDQVVVESVEDPLCYFIYHILNDPSRNTAIHSLRDVVGPYEGVIMAFAAWAYDRANGLSPPGIPERCVVYHLREEYSSDTRASFIDTRDEMILGHLGPPAKYYGFKMLFAHVDIQQKGQWVQHREFQNYAVQYRVGDWRMGVHGPVEMETAWELAGMDGNVVLDAPLVAHLDEELKSNGWILNNHLGLENDEGRELEVIDRGLRSDTLRLTCRKRASFLIILPPSEDVPMVHN
ncbi:hypothetical protein D9611_009188 [Ephemerocybe angulata]|uniref:Uncharacterized protein n=1 Tax=Ephemerocybe angulata TaxID=980116 RepID=A0A8H5CDL9_9AGAR|nr:hypothetical protein D9611_009188 [Tulosesus angulatus]